MKTIKTVLLLLVVGLGGLSMSGCDDGVGTPGPPTETFDKQQSGSPE